jgi:hypothetical protein
MKETLGAAKAAPWDFGRLEGGFRKCAALAPKESGWTADWSALSIAGADAAKRSDKDGVSKACADCHAKFRKAYRESYRDRPLPR